jgi:ankyrin repeat protein
MYTPLIHAAENGHADCVRVLLDAGADKDAVNEVRCGRFNASTIMRVKAFQC